MCYSNRNSVRVAQHEFFKGVSQVQLHAHTTCTLERQVCRKVVRAAGGGRTEILKENTAGIEKEDKKDRAFLSEGEMLPRRG